YGHFAAGPQARWLGASDEQYPARYVRSEQQSQRELRPAALWAAARRGAAAKGAYRRCCRSSAMSDIAFVAAPRICPPGARAKVSLLFLYRPLGCTRSLLALPA